MQRITYLGLALGSAVLLPAQDAAGRVDLSDQQHGSIGEAVGEIVQGADDWFERFDFYGFISTRYMHTESPGRHPGGFLGVHQAQMYMEAQVRDVGTAVLEIEFEYYRENNANGTGVNEAYMQFRDVATWDGGSLGVKVGRWDLPFGETYLYEDPDVNKLVSLPVGMPYHWDEGVMLFGNHGDHGFVAAVSEGSQDRAASNGISPAFTAKVYSNPTEDLYLSASGFHAHRVAFSAMCISGTLLGPVAGGVAGTSPNSTIDVTAGSFDAKWKMTKTLSVQTQVGTGHVSDVGEAFDRDFYFWTLEPSWAITADSSLTARWSGVGTFDDDEGYRFEGREFANGSRNYGYDLKSIQRVSLGVAHRFALGLLGKVETGMDWLAGTEVSGLPDEQIGWVAAEFVLSF